MAHLGRYAYCAYRYSRLPPGLRPEEEALLALLSGYYTAGTAGIFAGRANIMVYLARVSRQGGQRSQSCQNAS
jgi:hypothetical protein